MGINTINSNYSMNTINGNYSTNAINHNKKVEGQNTQQENKTGIDNFTTMQWQNKNDGKTYIAKKLTIKQGDKEITGIFVFDKMAKPNEKGIVPGEFMNYDTFMKKISGRSRFRPPASVPLDHV